ncbi:hypothetical protein BHE74_00036518 [Ensete ventricosum]|nr:hypothetical protein BHE74_00036518 [Ensete ventricosum]
MAALLLRVAALAAVFVDDVRAAAVGRNRLGADAALAVAVAAADQHVVAPALRRIRPGAYAHVTARPWLLLPYLLSISCTHPLTQIQIKVTKQYHEQKERGVRRHDSAITSYVLIKQLPEKNKEAEEQVTAPATPTESAVTEEKSVVVPVPIPVPIKVLPPIPEQEQRQLFKWILEEKRKVKPSDPAEKKKLDEEKALLKQFIRAKSVPSL